MDGLECYAKAAEERRLYTTVVEELREPVFLRGTGATAQQHWCVRSVLARVKRLLHRELCAWLGEKLAQQLLGDPAVAREVGDLATRCAKLHALVISIDAPVQLIR